MSCFLGIAALYSLMDRPREAMTCDPLALVLVILAVVR